MSYLYDFDVDLETEGKWIEWGGEVAFLIAAAGNENAKRLSEKLNAKYSRPGFRSRQPTEEEAVENLRKIAAHAICRGWRGDLRKVFGPQFADQLRALGVSVDDDVCPSYTPEVAEGLMRLEVVRPGSTAVNKIGERFLRDVVRVATEEDLFRAEQVEEDRGN